jgi:hypothetical protein
MLPCTRITQAQLSEMTEELKVQLGKQASRCADDMQDTQKRFDSLMSIQLDGDTVTFAKRHIVKLREDLDNYHHTCTEAVKRQAAKATVLCEHAYK